MQKFKLQTDYVQRGATAGFYSNQNVIGTSTHSYSDPEPAGCNSNAVIKARSNWMQTTHAICVHHVPYHIVGGMKFSMHVDNGIGNV